jgi:hypothetical protein
MAKKKRSKTSWLRWLLLFIFTPLVVWLLAFLLWFYWKDVAKLFSADRERLPPAPKATEQVEPARQRPSEKILDEDRKKLDEILKNKGR